MRPRSVVRTVGRGLGVLFVAALALPAAARAATPSFATVEAVDGQVVVVRAGQTQAATPGLGLQLDDVVVTKLGRASVRFQSDGTVVRVGPESRVQVNESATERDITVFFGRLWAHVVRWRERPTRFTTAGTIAAVRGTELSMAVETEGDRTQLAVFEGLVHAQNDAGSLEVAGGQSATASKGKAPVRGVTMRPSDAVQWALYYPPVLSVNPSDFEGGAAWQTKARQSAEAWGKGDLEKALASLEGVDETGIREPKFFAYRASLFLATGNVDEAGKELDRALKLSANDANALAVQSIVELARNETDKALQTARRATTADAKSAAAQVALSYAQQARFDLPGARASLEKAVELDAKDALAWARLAEIRSSLGLLGPALEAARKAAELSPGLSRAQTVLGYAYLTEVRTAEAKAAFDEAVKLDQSDPLPRLGLGLARIRDGHLAEGSKEIEVAVSLDPGMSLLRSYLGKAYFEDKRENLVSREYELAKQADPKDPTPYLYDAIDKQTTNRPVEALEDVEKAIELNDNRAVYRSRLLLDADLAARSASLGRIYSDLGFQDLGLVEGWDSVNTDPSDYSGHRLLADTYAALPRHEIARVSELFQSQMLQPLNTTAIQPRLGESNLLLIATGGPNTLSFNEFNPLFNRDQVRFQGDFLAGEDSTFTGDGIVSGIYKKASFSAGYSGFKTDGFRKNDDQDDKIANAFVQAELNPSTSVQAEYRYRKSELGDVRLRFFPDDYFPGERRKEEWNTVRAGLRESFSPGSVLLASVMYQDLKGSINDDQPGFPLVFAGDNEKQHATGTEGQYLFRSPRVSLTAGLGFFDISGTIDTTATVDPELVPPPDNTFTATIDTQLKHTDVYAYSYLKPVPHVTATVGLSGDFLRSETVLVGDHDQFNPKFGLVWKPGGGTTIRGAAFRTLKRTLITDQTLEPTQVAGFNQFYDDLNATKAWVYGGAIDQKFTRRVFGGFEYSKRDTDMPYVPDPSNPVQLFQKGHENWARAYFFVTPHPWLAVRADYLFERFESEGLTDLPTKVDTHRLPLGVSFFHPRGISASLTATYVDQSGDFVRLDSTKESGSDNFWTVDAAVTYRLPKRYGFVAVGGTNLFDEQFSYYDTDVRNPTIQPTRRLYAKVVVAF
jgi:tetratricopeptide (TPR) repeat protein